MSGIQHCVMAGSNMYENRWGTNKAAKPNLTPVTLPERTRQWESSAAPSTWLVRSECHYRTIGFDLNWHRSCWEVNGLRAAEDPASPACAK